MKTLVFDNIFNISGCAFTFCSLILRRGTGRWDPGFPTSGRWKRGREEERKKRGRGLQGDGNWDKL